MPYPGYYLDPANAWATLGFSDVPNWRGRDIDGALAQGRQGWMPDANARPQYNQLPASNNVQDRRNDPQSIGSILAAPWLEDPFIRGLWRAYSAPNEAVMHPLHLPLGSPLGAAAGVNDLAEFGPTEYGLKQFKRGETPGSIPTLVDKIKYPWDD